MKWFWFLPCIFLSASLIGSEIPDSTKNSLHAAATISLNSNGIASIPAFSLGKPALMSTIVLSKGRFSYEPTLAYGPDLKPWYIDNWVNYKIVNQTSFELRAAFNISTFFSDLKVPDKTVLQGQRYFAFALTAVYKYDPNGNVSLAYWSDNGQDGGIKGHFFNLAGERTNMNLGKNLLLGIAAQLFYINYDGKNDGLFFSPKISTSLKECPLALFFQCNQGIQSNIEPFPSFQWNVGLAYSL